MSASEQGPKIKYGESAPKLDKAQLQFMKLIEEQNLDRVQKLKRIRRNNLLTAGALGVSVLAIYGYSRGNLKCTFDNS